MSASFLQAIKYGCNDQKQHWVKGEGEWRGQVTSTSAVRGVFGFDCHVGVRPTLYASRLLVLMTSGELCMRGTYIADSGRRGSMTSVSIQLCHVEWRKTYEKEIKYEGKRDCRTRLTARKNDDNGSRASQESSEAGPEIPISEELSNEHMPCIVPYFTPHEHQYYPAILQS
ncbi:hypothetical protein FIBSPDRAFT_939511 [Athelia psychrophila]|uniref:Uncharacterized protein n=1 Tax=Athelia psychrophila TaxID=1759441 RepID=A0A167XMY8_9AGAM|nr:hypothetical protein FIBSPDRAFT_939511 [Fibularhizoctonia sp. CBS 109695]